MKNTINNIVLVFVFALITFNFSCEDRLEEILPEDDVSSGSIFNTFATINGAVTGLYSINQSGDLNGFPQIIQDFMADDVNFVGSFPSLQDLRDFQALSTNATIDDIWLDSYRLIGACNNVIINVPNIDAESIDGITDGLKSQYVAEAKFLRALTYFNLANVFSQPYQFSNGSNLAVPIQLDLFKGGDISSFQLPRNTLNEVHAQIELDLTEAIADLPISNGVRASSTAARALLARLYLYRGEWLNAANTANTVLNTDGVALANDYNFYNDVNTSPELIFTVVNTPTDPPRDPNPDSGGINERYAVYYTGTPNGRGDCPFTQSLLDAYNQESGDLRFSSLTTEAPNAGGNNSFFTTKYPDFQNNGSNGMVLRTTEMVLIRAEANLNANTNVGSTPLADINSLRARAGLNDLSSVDIDVILNERRKELAFEGHRRMDLLRNERNLRPDNAAVSAPGSDKVIFPIVDNELDNNPNAIQNSGY